MTTNISKEQSLLNAYRGAVAKAERDGFVPFGRIRRTIVRHDGEVDETVLPNIVTKDGLNAMATQIVAMASPTSDFAYLIVGTATTAGSLGSVQGGIGEVSRKLASTLTSSNEVAILVATWAGNADGLTGIALGSCGITNHASSGSGTFGSHVNSVSATLQASDFLKIQYEIQVGSHAL